MKYIDADKLNAALALHYAEITIPVITDEGGIESYFRRSEIHAIQKIIDSLQQEQTDMGEVSDGYHTFNELYYYRMLYNAAFFNLLPKEWVHKSKKHHTGEECFGGGWFIVMANLPTGQISNHYELKDWDLFKVPEKEIADEWDGHTPQEAAERLYKYLQQEQPDIDDIKREWYNKGYLKGRKESNIPARELGLPKSCDMQEQLEVFDTVAFQKGVQEGRRLEREEMPKWRNYGPNIIKDPFVTDLGSLVVGEKCIRIYELYNLPGFKND